MQNPSSGFAEVLNVPWTLLTDIAQSLEKDD